MNERIRELSEQAGFAQWTWQQRDSQEERIQKLAELIVRECLKITMLTHSEGNEDCYSYDEALEHVHFNMKQHFGVEE